MRRQERQGDLADDEMLLSINWRAAKGLQGLSAIFPNMREEFGAFSVMCPVVWYIILLNKKGTVI